MQRIALVLLVLSSFVLNSSFAADILFEPYIGIGRWTPDTTVSGLDDTTTIAGPGLRFAYTSLPLLSFGLDYRTLTSSDNSRANMLGAYIGLDLPILLRFWAEFILNANYDLGTSSDITSNGGHILGIGFTGLPFISINLELITAKYTVEDIPSIGDEDIINQGYLLSVSFPLEF